jgi:hypothetical protein
MAAAGYSFIQPAKAIETAVVDYQAEVDERREEESPPLVPWGLTTDAR